MNKEIKLGQQLTTPIIFVMDMETLDSIQSSSHNVNVVLVLVITICFLLAFIGGNMLSTWTFINFMQLLFHLPLIRTDLPAHA